MLKLLTLLVFVWSCTPTTPPAPEPIQPPIDIATGASVGVTRTDAATLVKVNPAVVPSGAAAMKVTCGSIYYGEFALDDIIYLPKDSTCLLGVAYVNTQSVLIFKSSYILP